MNNNIQNIFGVSGPQLQSIVAEGLRGGGNWCDLYFEHTAYIDLLLRDSQVGSAGYHIDYGCGIRVLSGEKTGYAYAESTDYASLLEAARAAGSIASAQTGIGTPAICQAGACRPRHGSGGTTSVVGSKEIDGICDSANSGESFDSPRGRAEPA